MKREQLAGMNLTDEHIDRIMGIAAGELEAERAKTAAAKEQVTTLTADIAQRDIDLAALKKAADGNAELQSKYEQLQTQYKESTEKVTAETEAALKRAAIKIKYGGEMHDANMVIDTLDLKAVKLDKNGDIESGLDDQYTARKKEKPFLFKEAEKPQAAGYKPADNGVKGQLGDRASWDAKITEARKNNQQLAVIQLKREAAEAGHVIN